MANEQTKTEAQLDQERLAKSGILGKVPMLFESWLDSKINDLNKSGTSQAETLEKKEKEGGFGRKGLIFDPFVENNNAQGLFRPKSGYITNQLLKQVARRAPAASIIINILAGQVQTFCRDQADRFDNGWKFMCKDKSQKPDPKEIESGTVFITNCGNPDDRAPQDKLSFSDWGYMVSRDLLVYGHSAIERGQSRAKTMGIDGPGIGYFLPLASEGIYYASPKADPKAVHAQRNLWRERADEHKEEQDKAPPAEKIEYVQVMDNKVVEEFTHEELIFAKLNSETDIDLQGYCIGPLERALSMITAQLQVENHQRGFFTNGVASRGLLVIQGDMTPNQLKMLQAQWTQQVTGPLNSWRTPILAGIKGVQWVPLTAGNRDMEYAAYQDHVLRTIHACFAIDPEETGFGYLAKGNEQRSLGESSNEYKISASKSRSLRPLLARIEAIMNEDVLPYWNKEFAAKYRFCFVGLDAETRGEETDRLTKEVAVTTTVNEVRRETERAELPIGGNLILNPLLIQTLQANLYKGVFMEYFMGVTGASERPDLQYIPEQFWFAWQNLQMQMMQQQAMGEAAENGEMDGDDENQDGDGGEKKGPPQKKGDKDKDDDKGGDDKKKGPPGKNGPPGQQQDPAAAAAAAKAQGKAVMLFMQSNPDLFKAMRNTMLKSQVNDDLSKSGSGRPNDSHVDKLAAKLMKDHEDAAEKFMKEVMAAVHAEVEEHTHEENK
jgi:hypothetical protein